MSAPGSFSSLSIKAQHRHVRFAAQNSFATQSRRERTKKSEHRHLSRMGWTGRAPALNGSQSAWARKSTVDAVTAIGMDMGKTTLHMVGLNSRGAIVLREKVSRGSFASRLANLSPCLIGISGTPVPSFKQLHGH